MNKISKGAIAGTLVLFLAGSSAFAATTSSSTTTIKTSTANGVTTTTTTTTTKTTETKTTTASTKKENEKKPAPAANQNNKKDDKKPAVAEKCTKKDHSRCDHNKKDDKHNARPDHKKTTKVANCPHTKECKDSKTCEQLKNKSAKLTCNGKPNCQMHAGTYYEHKYHKVTVSKKKDGSEKPTVQPKKTVAEEKPMKKLPSNKTTKA